ncbi:MAG TPA: thymidine kinase [Motilibacteraceae bacterium]|nr:thymidine kinase [Motilibacteraceae bacterium]
MAELVFFSGTMDCGKSTLALQMDHNRRARGLRGVIYTAHDRAGQSRLSSRLGLEVPAVEVTPELDFRADVGDRLVAGERVDYLVCDEAMFYSPEQVEQLARVVDELGVDVMAFGLTTDFRSRLFPGSARLIELADRFEVLQVEALCWCGARGTHNARTVGGRMVMEGETVVVGDTVAGPDAAGDDIRPEVAYEVLCRRHHMRRATAASARAAELSPEPLPFDARTTAGAAR